ncbi:MAG TPA: copper chaperone PCu(A)C [Steroidobacteraceae bacterium]|jgi:copper(I)-binding protein|nr:copper chaperone PCu(A)C [Steroidobacteraceae bacterium]
MNALRRITFAALLGATTLAAAASSTIQITDAWIRWLPGNLPAGGYLTVINSGDHPVGLIGASSPDYARVTLHQSRQQGGVASMVPVGAVTILPHSTLAFEVKGYHFMLEQPKKPLKPGDHVIITLQFDSRSSIAVQFEVRAAAAS